jgi:hypothetical protein
MSAIQAQAARIALGAFGVGSRLVLVLLASRAVFRMTAQLAPLLLALTWGPVRFGQYAGAVGLSGWTMFVAFCGEKAALKLLPRTTRLRGRVARVTLAVGAAPMVCAVVAVTLGLALGAGSTVLLLLVAVLWSASVGFLQVVAALHRMRGAPLYDAGAFFGLAVAVVVTTLLTIRLGWSPLGQLTSVAATAVAVAVAMLLALPRPSFQLGRPSPPVPPGRQVGTSGHRIVYAVLRTCCLLGLPELLGALSVAVCYLALAVTRQQTQTGVFYVAAVLSGFCSAAVIYLLRLGQPQTSIRLRGPASAVGRRQARRVLGIAIGISATCSVALTGLLLVRLEVPGPGWLLLAMLTVVEIPLFALVSYASYLLENTNGRALVVTSGAALVGVCAAGAAVTVLVPARGAAGAMGSLVISLGAVAAIMRCALSWHDRRRSALTP